MSIPEDAATVLEQFVHDGNLKSFHDRCNAVGPFIDMDFDTVANLPAEIAHLYEEAEAKQIAINECTAIINHRDAQIQKFIKHNGSLVVNPKEEQYKKTILENMEKAMALQEEKLALIQKAMTQFDRFVKRLDIKIRDLQADGSMPTDPQMPTLLRDSVGNLAPPASTSGTGTNTPLQPVSSNIGGGPANIANAAIARIASVAAGGRSSSMPTQIGTPKCPTRTETTRTNTASGMQPHPMLNSSHLANAPSIAAMNITRGVREMSVSSDVKRRRLNATLGSLPPQGSNLRQSSLGPGTPKPSTPGVSRAGSLGPRPVKKSATTKRVPASQLARKKVTKGGLPKKLGRRITGLSRASPSTTGDESAISEISDDENTSNMGGGDDDMDMDDDAQEDNTPYCYCREKSHGSMIMCDNADCKIQWFHWTCVGITEDPTGDWFCKDCSKLPPSKIRKAPQG